MSKRLVSVHHRVYQYFRQQCFELSPDYTRLLHAEFVVFGYYLNQAMEGPSCHSNAIPLGTLAP